MLKNLAIIFTLMLVSVASVTSKQASAFEDQIQKIRVLGEFAISDNQTAEQAYEAAVGLAKIKAAQQIGQYFEVVKLTDTDTGVSKEYLASVSSANLKHLVLSRRIQMVDENLVAVVELEVEYNIEDMQRSLSRFMENRELQAQIIESEGRLRELNAKLETQQRLTKEAQKLQHALVQKSDDAVAEKEDLIRKIKELETVIGRVNSNIAQDVKSYYTSVAKLDVSEVKVNASTRMSAYNKLLEEIEVHKKQQLNAIQNFVTKIKNKTYVAESIDFQTNMVSYQPFYRWDVDPGYLPTLFGRDYVENYKFIESGGRKSLYYSENLYPTTKHTAIAWYSLFYVVEINDYKYEIPIIRPLSSEHNESTSSREFCQWSISNFKEKFKRLCVVYRQNRNSEYDVEVIGWIDKRKLLKKVTVPLSDKNVVIKRYYDIRENGGEIQMSYKSLHKP